MGIAEKFKEARSTNVQNTETTNDGDDDNDGVITAFIATMKTMYIKYIEAGNAPLEINISSRQRRRIQQVVEKQSGLTMIKSILKLLESAVEEITTLLTGSAMRFNPNDMRTRSRMGAYSHSSSNGQSIDFNL